MSTNERAIEVGRIDALFRYPVKSMRGESIETADLGWHGLEGDRRLAFRRRDDRGEFPWLTASRLPDLVCFTPRLPGHVITPEGELLPLWGDELAADVGRRSGVSVEMMRLRHGIFDEAGISVITSTTAGEICRLAETREDVRRFRPNVVLRSRRAVAFEEDGWLGGTLTFGGETDSPTVAVTGRDVRCAMVNLDPDRGNATPEVLKAVASANRNHAGIYATVTRTGRLAVGQPVVFHPGTTGGTFRRAPDV